MAPSITTERSFRFFGMQIFFIFCSLTERSLISPTREVMPNRR